MGSFLPGTRPPGDNPFTTPLEYDHIDTRILSSHPFELIHFEYWRLADNEPMPDWAPTRTVDSEGRIHEAFYWETIESQSQLESSGLGDCGQIDFSKNKVLLCAMLFDVKFPVMIGFGFAGYTGSADPRLWPAGKYGPMLLLSDTRPRERNSEGLYIYDLLKCPFRFAMLIDKDEPVFSSSEIHLFPQFCMQLFFSSLSDEMAIRMAEAFAWNR